MSWGEWGQRRARRLLIPFVFWSTVYFTLHIVKLVAHHQAGQINEIGRDPAGLILSGGGSVALNFVPLLFAGLVVIQLFAGSWGRRRSWVLVIGFLVALIFYALWSHYNFAYHPMFSSPSAAPLKLILGLAGHGLRCAPLIFAAALLARWLPVPGTRNACPLVVTGGLLVALSSFGSLPHNAMDLPLGTGAFLIAWGLSGRQWATLAGLFSFGVYLVHQIFLELIQAIFPDRRALDVMGSLAITAVVYAASMLAVGWASRGGSLARTIFGLK